jgi:uncharacterized protein (DUF58 family)
MSLRYAGIFLCAAAILMAIAGTWSGNPAVATAWRLPAALLLAGLAYESIVIRRARLTLRIEAPECWRLGRAQRAKFLFSHALARTLALETPLAAPDSFAFERAVRTLTMPAATRPVGLPVDMTPRLLGAHRWPPVRVRIAGPLGLAWWTKAIAVDGGAQARVVPELLSAGSAPAGIDGDGPRDGVVRGDGTEILQLRRYRIGDPPRVIDWKATARSGQLVSRDFTDDQSLDVMILVDAGRASALRAGELDRLGHYANVAARLAQHALARGDSVGLLIYADRPLLVAAPARGSSALIRVRSALEAVRAQRTDSSPIQASLRARSLLRRRSLIVLLTDVDDAALSGQLADAVRLLVPKNLPFIAGLSSASVESLARAPASHWLDPYRSLAAQEYVVGLERKVRALAALGAPAVVARPEHLEQSVFDAYATFRRQRRI